jgi:hypothetical protein
MTTPIGLPGYGVLAVIALIIFLISKELLSASEQQNMSVSCYLNMGISSLLLPFAAIVLFSTTAALSLT